MSDVECTQAGGVARIALNRPATRNAFDAAVIQQLTESFERLGPEVRIVVLSGRGESFCAGADLQWMRRSAAFSTEENRLDAQNLARLFNVIDTAPQAVIGRIHGAAMGGGAGLAACCDLVAAAENTRFAFSEARLGLVPAVISPFVLRKIGVANARRYFLTAETFDARVAQRMGLIHEAVPDAELDKTVEAWVVALGKCGPRAIGEAKRLIAHVAGMGPTEARVYAVDVIARLRVSAEGQEGLAAFLEKRKPSWT